MAALALAAVAALAATPGPASASAPALPAGCTGNSFAFPNTTPAAVSHGASPVSSTIQVAGAQPYLRDLDLLTNISHTFSDDLDVTLTSPAGTVATITTDNGGGNDNVFGNGVMGTRWDDDAGTPVTDSTPVNGAPSPQLVPEEAMAAFIGENPNGTWTLTVNDDAVPDNGNLNSWSLELATIEGTPTEATTVSPVGTTGAIPNPGTLMATAAIAGAGTYLSELRLNADISHLASGDLGITLRSPLPTATASTISSNNGATFDNIFGDGMIGTLWYDAAGDAMTDPGGGPVTDAEFQNNVVETNLVPEEAMGAFIGENPNGTWNLEISDTTVSPLMPPPPDGGNLVDWTLTAKTISGCTTGGVNMPPTADAGGPYTVGEGNPLNLDGGGSDDPDAGPSPLTYSWDVNGDGTFGDATGETPNLSGSQVKALGIDGPDTVDVRVLVFDGEASDTSDPATLTVTNRPPTLTITGPTSATATQSDTWTFSSTDPSAPDEAGAFTYEIDWDGDGIPNQTVNGDISVDVPHTYASAGNVTMRATSTDKDGGESTEATRAVAVAQAPLTPPQGGQALGGQPTPTTPAAKKCKKRKRNKGKAASAKRKRCKKRKKKGR